MNRPDPTHSPISPASGPARLLHGVVLVAVYFAAAKLGLKFATVANSATFLWPPTGIALFALVTYGIRLWPAVFIGALAVNLTTGVPDAAALGIAVGNTLEAVAGCYLLRAGGFEPRLLRVRDVVMLILFAAALSTTISASIGALSIAYLGVIPWSGLGDAWITWWMGDAMGDLSFASLLFAWWGGRVRQEPRRVVEGAILAVCLVVATQMIFGEPLGSPTPWPLAFLTFPLLSWAALRFGMRGATGAALIIGIITLANVVAGHGLFARASTLESLVLLWLYVNVLAVTGMALAASVAERQRAEAQVRHLTQHDPLTGLPNRLNLQAQIREAIERAEADSQKLAVLFVDIDRFKIINDSLGHTVGDRLLNMIGERMRSCLRHTDNLTRHAGDEFVILVEDPVRSEDAGKVALKVLEGLRQPFLIDSMPLHLSGSIGISLYPADGRDADTLLKNADIAMYRAKDFGRNSYLFYSSDMNMRAAERLVMENELRYALGRGEFFLHYQALYDAATARVVGVEALLRWRRVDGELVSPDSFIPLLEETGLIGSVGNWVLDAACSQLAEWQARGARGLRMSVNVSSHQLRDVALPQFVAAALAARNLSPDSLELEITESMLVRQDSIVENNIQQLVGLGVRLAVDDFGTGYSSLSYLHRLSIDTLKVDRSFVTNLPHDENCVAIARAIVGLGKSLRLQLVAEGVETQEQRAFLRDLGCDVMQGYLFSRPVPAEEFARVIAVGGASLASPG